MTEEERIQRMDDFINNRLPTAEAAAFRREIAEDTVLAKEVDMHHLMLTAIVEDAAIEKLTLHLQALEREHKTANTLHEPLLPGRLAQKPFIRTAVFRWMAGIAATVFMCTLGYFMLAHESSSRKLYSDYYRPYPMAEVSPATGRGSASQTDKEKALRFYEEEQYDKAVHLLELFMRDHRDVAASFYLGASYLQESKTDEAIEAFKSVTAVPSNDYTDPAIWYLALAFLKKDQPQEAIPYLNILRRGKGEFSEKAHALIDKIK